MVWGGYIEVPACVNIKSISTWGGDPEEHGSPYKRAVHLFEGGRWRRLAKIGDESTPMAQAMLLQTGLHTFTVVGGYGLTPSTIVGKMNLHMTEAWPGAPDVLVDQVAQAYTEAVTERLGEATGRMCTPECLLSAYACVLHGGYGTATSARTWACTPPFMPVYYAMPGTAPPAALGGAAAAAHTMATSRTYARPNVVDIHDLKSTVFQIWMQPDANGSNCIPASDDERGFMT